MATLVEVEAYFSNAASAYQAASRRALWRKVREREARAVVQTIGDVAGRDVLELGCGAGFYTRLLLERGARHELYEFNCAGSYELVRLFPRQLAQGNGTLKQMEGFAEACMADYDENGWLDPAYHSGDDISVHGK